MSLSPWRELAVPHDDVLRGHFKQADLAADLTAVHTGKATPEYGDAAQFYGRTFITEGMRALLDTVVKRLAHGGGDPVIRLQTSFGGGKTHSMLAVYHLAKGATPTKDMPGVGEILNRAGVTEAPRATPVVIDGTNFGPNTVRTYGKTKVHTLWGELAWQLGGEAAYARVKDADISGTSPGKEVLAELINAHSPCVILMDELVSYFGQFEDGKSFTGGTFASNIAFIQALTEALKQTPRAVLLASLPESEKQAGSTNGVQALHTLETFFKRIEVVWKTTSTEEAFSIVRKRLFKEIRDDGAVNEVCRAFADHYRANKADFPPETLDNRYEERLRHAYPLHPEVLDRLYEDWSTLVDFQKTRGVLKLMALVIHRLWQSGNQDLMILPGALPLSDAALRAEALSYLPSGWEPVIEGDIDGAQAEATDLDTRDPYLGKFEACRRVARTLFLGSAVIAPSSHAQGMERSRILLGVVQPGQPPAVYGDALKKLSDRLKFLNSANSRHWFGTKANLRQEMEARKARLKLKEDLLPQLRELLDKAFANRAPFAAVHPFTPSSDIADDESLRLVILPPDKSHGKDGPSLATAEAADILTKRGNTPRRNQNRLIFLAVDRDLWVRLADHLRTFLAWRSIVSDAKSHALNIDLLMLANAEAQVETSRKVLDQVLRDSYKWLLAPIQYAAQGSIGAVEWECRPVANTGALNAEIEKILREQEWVIAEWSPIHLDKLLLKAWYWRDGKSEILAKKVWQDSCCYLYMPRLKDAEVFKRAAEKGSSSKDYFALAHGKDGAEFKGLTFGTPTSLILDDSALFVEPKSAIAYAEKKASEEVAKIQPTPADLPTGEGHIENSQGTVVAPKPAPTTPITYQGAKTVAVPMKRFWGSKKLNALTAKNEFKDIFDEIIMEFNLDANATVELSLDIRVTHPKGFSDQTQRAVRENAKHFKLGEAEFTQE